jgi:predicted nucleotidyltransferase
MITNQLIDNISKMIVQKVNPEKIILFGSYANGTFNEDSDLDLIIIKDTNLPKHKRGTEIRKYYFGHATPMDIKVYTPEEYVLEQKNQYSFLSSALKSSKTLYERKT